MHLRQLALHALLICDPQAKAQAALALQAAVASGELPWQSAEADEVLALSPEQAARMPGRPELPRLVSATQVPARSPFTKEGHAALLHAICHIEFNAIKSVFLVSITLSPGELQSV